MNFQFSKVFRGVIFITLMTCGAFSALFWLIPVVVTIHIHFIRVIIWRRKWANYISGLYFDFLVSLIYLLGGTTVKIYSDSTEILVDEGPVIISNHTSKIDWMFSGWCYAALTNRSAELKMMVRESFRSLPIFGWGMQIMMYIFVRRSKNSDIPHIMKHINYLLNCAELNRQKQQKHLPNSGDTDNSTRPSEGSEASSEKKNCTATNAAATDPSTEPQSPLTQPLPQCNENHSPATSVASPPLHTKLDRPSCRDPCVFFLPEGTDLSVKNTDRSNAFARSHGYPEWNHVLYPKSAGLAAVLSCMRLQQNTFNFEASSNYSTHSAYKSIYRIRSKSNLSEKSVNGSGGSEKSKLQSRAVHDITIAYDRYISKSGGSCGQRYNEWSLASGQFPTEVHLIVRRYPIHTLPADEGALQKWLREIFAYKESLLSDYNAHRCTPPDESMITCLGEPDLNHGIRNIYTNGTPVTAVVQNLSTHSSQNPYVNFHPVNLNKCSERIQWPPEVICKPMVNSSALITVLLWILLLLSGLLYSSVCRWICTCMIATYAGFRAVGGFDYMELLLHSALITPEQDGDHNVIKRVKSAPILSDKSTSSIGLSQSRSQSHLRWE